MHLDFIKNFFFKNLGRILAASKNECKGGFEKKRGPLK
jgi:hypothetical protein